MEKLGIQTTRNELFDQLSGHIASFNDRFRKLSKQATFKDLGLQFVESLHEIFPNTIIDLARWSAADQVWEPIVDGGLQGIGKLAILPEEKNATGTEVHSTPDSIIIVQRLPDDSAIGLVICATQPEFGHTEFDIACLLLFVRLLHGAYQDLLSRKHEREMVFTLNQRILQLNSLIDTGIEIASLQRDAAPHRLALVRATSVTNAARGMVRVVSGLEVRDNYCFPESMEPPDISNVNNRISSSFTYGDAVYTFDLFEKESRKGVIPFDGTDQLLLDALSRQVHASLENRYLHQKALENQRIEQEMNVAASIQKKIIPVSLVPVPGYDIAGKNIPSKFVGGDYYDCIPLPDGRFALVVADVTGKGMPAALLVSSTHAYLAAYLEGSYALPDLARKLNKALYQASTEDKFVTGFIAILSPATGEIEYLSAGHNPGYLLRTNGVVEEINVGGFPLGMFEMDLGYESSRISLEKGERLLLYTDGVTEAQNEQNELYDEHHKLTEFFARHQSGTGESFISDLITDVKQFTNTAPQSDDITLLYLHRLP